MCKKLKHKRKLINWKRLFEKIDWWKVAEYAYLFGSILILVICMWFAIFWDGAKAAGTDESDEGAASTVSVVSTDTEAIDTSDIPTTDVVEEVVDIPAAPVIVTETVTYYDVPLSEDLQDYIFELCEAYDVDPAVVIAMIWKESTYNPECIGDSGDSRGLMQIQEKWHKKRMEALGCLDLMDPYQNVTVGIDIFAGHMKVGKGVEYALMAYNGGGSYAKRKHNAGEVSYYATKVLEKSRSLTTYSVERVVEGG